VAIADTATTGILVGSASPIWVQISGNSISRDHYGIYLEGTGHVVHASLYGNDFRHVPVPVKEVIAP
jgi:hypothetical protein